MGLCLVSFLSYVLSKYTDIFFDLDRTLWDFDRNSAETLTELYEAYEVDRKLGIRVEEFVNTFRKINAEAWREFRNGVQTKDDMRVNRFVNTFFLHGSSDWKTARKMSLDYINTCPHKSQLVKGVPELLENLRSNYKLHIITNGFSDTQSHKINAGRISHYFSTIVISDETPYRKPEREIFELAVTKAGSHVKASLMVGDDWQKDILGAKSAGMDQAFYNPESLTTDEKATIELKRIDELTDYLQD